jgi:hypothetical protein
MSAPNDKAAEKGAPAPDVDAGTLDPGESGPTRDRDNWTSFRGLLHKAAVYGRVEVRGIAPIPVKERTVEKTVNVFTLWWSMSTNILP